jgi:hypothetical protein
MSIVMVEHQSAFVIEDTSAAVRSSDRYRKGGNRMRVLFAAICAITLIGISRGYAASQPAGPSVVVEPSRITVSGVTPGGQVLFFGAGFEPKRYYVVPHRWSKVLDADVKRTVSYELDAPVTWNAVWIVADLTTGRYAIASTPGFPIEESHLTHRSFHRDALGAVSQFAYQRPVVDFLYLAPGGAWTQLTYDGDSSDADGKDDGVTTVDLGKLLPLGARKSAPTAFAPGGTLFIIDLSRLDVLELKIDGSVLAGAQ